MHLRFQKSRQYRQTQSLVILKSVPTVIAAAVVVAVVVASQVLQIQLIQKTMMRIQVKSQQMRNQLKVQPLHAVAVAAVQQVKA